MGRSSSSTMRKGEGARLAEAGGLIEYTKKKLAASR
jgi:hypothetical protein